jgi:hypothetical protein
VPDPVLLPVSVPVLLFVVPVLSAEAVPPATQSAGTAGGSHVAIATFAMRHVYKIPLYTHVSPTA